MDGEEELGKQPPKKVRKIGGDGEKPGCSRSATYMNNGGGGRSRTSAPGTSSTSDGKKADVSSGDDKMDPDRDGGGGDDGGGDGGGGGDPDNFSWPNNLPHPLLIPDIVRAVLNRLGMSDVDRSRGICRVWKEESCAVLQAKKIVALVDSTLVVNHYHEQFSSTTDFPHAHFELQVDYLLDPEDIMLRFWTTFGPHVKILDFREPTMYLESLFDIIDLHLPNLERLAMRFLPRKFPLGSYSYEEDERRSPPSPPRADWATLRFPQIRELTLSRHYQDEAATLHILTALLRSMPSLERLALVMDYAPTNVVVAQNVVERPIPAPVSPLLARLLVQVLTDPNIPLPALSILDVPIEVGDAELTALTEKRFPFAKLFLKVQKEAKSSVLTKFLVSVSPTLNYLEIEFPDGFFFTAGVTFPAYAQMELVDRAPHLRLVTDLTLKNFQGSMEFLRNLRLVRKLTINGSQYAPLFGFADRTRGPVRFDPFADQVLEPDNYHNLQVFRTDSYLDWDDLTSLAGSFPLLCVLKLVQVEDVDLGVIYRNLPYIQELEIIEGKITDQGISGVRLDVCNDLAQTTNFLDVDPVKYRTDLYLGSLQYLRTLKLVCQEVTDISIFFGIVDCGSLETLTLQSPYISDTGVNKIADTMLHLRYLDIHKCDRVSGDGQFFVQEKLKHVVPTLILDSDSMQRFRLAGNPFRQVGSRGRLWAFEQHRIDAINNGLRAADGVAPPAIQLPPPELMGDDADDEGEGYRDMLRRVERQLMLYEREEAP